jgi:uncharacterized membrane protein
MALVHPVEANTIATLAVWAEPWRRAFSTSVVVSTGVLFAHVASLVCAGGLSFAADRASLLSGTGVRPEAEQELCTRLANRRFAIRALTVVALSGVLLFLSDVDSFIHLRTFWLKMGLVALVITNSLLAQRHDGQIYSAGPVTARRNAQRMARGRVHARVSLSLWLLTILAGTAIVAG